MILRLKNQMAVKLKEMVTEALVFGGIPKHIELTESEAQNLLIEINATRIEGFAVEWFKVDQKEEEDEDIISIIVAAIFTKRNLSLNEVLRFIKQWRDEKFVVCYFDGREMLRVPLIINDNEQPDYVDV